MRACGAEGPGRRARNTAKFRPLLLLLGAPGSVLRGYPLWCSGWNLTHGSRLLWFPQHNLRRATQLPAGRSTAPAASSTWWTRRDVFLGKGRCSLMKGTGRDSQVRGDE